MRHFFEIVAFLVLIYWAILFACGCQMQNGCPFILDLFMCGGEDTGTGNPNAQIAVWGPGSPVYVVPYAGGYVISQP